MRTVSRSAAATGYRMSRDSSSRQGAGNRAGRPSPLPMMQDTALRERRTAAGTGQATRPTHGDASPLSGQPRADGRRMPTTANGNTIRYAYNSMGKVCAIWQVESWDYKSYVFILKLYTITAYSLGGTLIFS